MNPGNRLGLRIPIRSPGRLIARERTMTMTKKELRTARKRRRKARNQPTPKAVRRKARRAKAWKRQHKGLRS